MGVRPFFHSSSTLYLNASGLKDPAVDALVEAALSATHFDKFASACRALDRVLLWNYYQIPLDALGDTRIVYWDKFGRPDLPEEMYVVPFPIVGGSTRRRRRESVSDAFIYVSIVVNLVPPEDQGLTAQVALAKEMVAD